jgi:hypothetical protein
MTVNTALKPVGTSILLLCAIVIGCRKGGGESDDSKQLGELAQALCSCDRAGSPKLDAIPADLQKHIRQEDLDYLTQHPDAGIVKRDGGAQEEPPLRATCVVRAVDVHPTTALASLTRKSERGTVTDYSLGFVKASDGWRADYHLPEKEAAFGTAMHLKIEVVQLIEHFEVDQAMAKVTEARKLAPDDDELKKLEAGLEEALAGRVAGRWFKRVEKDAMTDKENVYMTLPALTDIETSYASKRPRLIARCVKGEMDLEIVVDAVVGGDIWGATAQYRFDAEPPQKTTMTESTDHKGLFFREPAKWLDRLTAHAAGKLIVEVPLFGRMPQAVTFDLTGADTAIPPVKSACGTK